MIDNDIIKALDCCSKAKIYADCEKMGCPLYLGIALECKYVDRENQLYSDALDLITRQRAEIEKLKEENKILSINADTAFQDGLNEAQKLYAEQIKAEIKSEAIKEFAMKLKCGVPQEYGVIRCQDVDNLVKEMVGRKNEN